jgi:hypothetical protein
MLAIVSEKALPFTFGLVTMETTKDGLLIQMAQLDQSIIKTFALMPATVSETNLVFTFDNVTVEVIKTLEWARMQDLQQAFTIYLLDLFPNKIDRLII